MRPLTRAVAAFTASVLSVSMLAACSQSGNDGGKDAAAGEGPSRIVAGSFAAANVLDDLDLEDRVVGITKKTKLPDTLDTYNEDKFANVGSLKEPDMSKIAELSPDLILVGRRTESMIPEFNKISDHVMNADADRVELLSSNREKVNELAGMFGKDATEKASKKLDEIDEKAKSVREKAEKAGTALVIMTSGGKVTAFGPGSGFNVIYKDLGFRPVTEIKGEGNKDPHGAPMSWEQIAELNPDHVFVIDRDSAINKEGASAQELLNNPVFNSTKAAREGGVHYLNSRHWYLVTGGLSVLEAMIDEVGQAAK